MIYGKDAEQLMQLNMVEHEILDIMKRPSEEFIPPSVERALERLSSDEPEERERLKKILLQGKGQAKEFEINKKLDDLKELLTPDSFAKVAGNIREMQTKLKK